VVHTLIEAVVLVFMVMYLFLQNFRYTIIPTIVVPVACWAPSPRCWRWASRSTC
jgi:multidrug efflux pump subunit AcrB